MQEESRRVRKVERGERGGAEERGKRSREEGWGGEGKSSFLHLDTISNDHRRAKPVFLTVPSDRREKGKREIIFIECLLCVYTVRKVL